MIVRPATLSDSSFIWRLSMEPSVRAMSTRGKFFHFDEHHTWYQTKMTNGLNSIWVAEVDGERVGQVRYGKIPQTREAEVAIGLFPQFRGHGYAHKMLAETEPLAKVALGVSKLTALVLMTNLASKYLFEHAGYTVVRPEVRMEKAHWRYEKDVR